MGAKLDKRLRVIWQNDLPSRYVPRALRPGVNHSWGVFDRQTERFLQDDEVAALTDAQCREVIVQ